MNWYKRQLKIAMPKVVNWSNEKLEQIKKLIEEGKSFRQIDRDLGLPESSARRLSNKYKWRDSQLERDKRDKLISELYLLPPRGKGMSGVEIKKQYGFDDYAIKRSLERLNLIEEYRGLGEAMKEVDQKSKWTPDLRREHSDRVKQRYIDSPGLRDEASLRKKKEWQDMGGLKGVLLSYPTKEGAINRLKGVAHGVSGGDAGKYMSIYNDYIKIINNHTYPDEIQQPQPV